MARSAIFKRISEDPELLALGVTKVYGALGAENPKEDRFVVLRYGDEDVAFSDVGTQILTVWVYDRDESYTIIDKAIKRIKFLLLDMVQVTGPGGGTVSQVSYNGASSDLYDDIMRRTTRNAVFTVNAR